MKIYSLLFLLLLFMISCDFNTFRENKPEDRQEAEKVTEKFYTLLKEGKKEEAAKLFSNDFFKFSKKSELDQILEWEISESKNMMEYKLADWTTLVVGGSSARSEYTLVYNVQRGKLKTREEFSLQKEKDKAIRILKYKMTAQQ